MLSPVCPQCGSYTYAKGGKQSQQEYHCPHCGIDVKHGNVHRIPQEALDTVNQKAWTCPDCETKITGFNYCPVCDTNDEQVVTIPDILKKMEDIVCTEGCDTGVVMLSQDGSTHTERLSYGTLCTMYDHAFFSPLGDALIDVYRSLQKLQTTQAVAPKCGPVESCETPAKIRKILAKFSTPEMKQKLSESVSEFIQNADYAWGEWNQDVGSIAVTQILLERDPDKITAILKRVYQAGWMGGNLADRVEIPKPDSGVKTDLQQ